LNTESAITQVPRKWSWGQIFWIALTFLFIWGTIFFSLESHRRLEDFHRWQTDKPIDMAVDFSKSSEYTGTFVQTCSRAHSEMAGLVLSASGTNTSSPSNLLAGLSATLELFEQGTSNRPDSSVVNIGGAQEEDGMLSLFSIDPRLKRGMYNTKIRVNSGAPALQGIQQRLQAKYFLCGLERLPADIARVAAIACLILGNVSVIVAIILTVRLRRRTSVQCSSKKRARNY
jgi:hypothetical protein